MQHTTEEDKGSRNKGKYVVYLERLRVFFFCKFVLAKFYVSPNPLLILD